MLKKGILFLLVFVSTCTWAQTPPDSTQVKSVVVSKKERKPRNPIKASILSAVLPSAGQIYNRKWWKAPLVWGGFTTAFLMHDFYYDKHKFYHQILIYKDQEEDDAVIETYADNNGDRFTSLTGADVAALSQSKIQALNDEAEKRKQQIYLMTSLFYILQIVDASVDAHFSTFDVSDDLTLQIKPAVLQNQSSFAPGINLKLSLRR